MLVIVEWRWIGVDRVAAKIFEIVVEMAGVVGAVFEFKLQHHLTGISFLCKEEREARFT